jgi:hypothetical protein
MPSSTNTPMGNFIFEMEGLADYEAGKSIADCPHEQGSRAGERWLAGWLQGPDPGQNAALGVLTPRQKLERS